MNMMKRQTKQSASPADHLDLSAEALEGRGRDTVLRVRTSLRAGPGQSSATGAESSGGESAHCG